MNSFGIRAIFIFSFPQIGCAIIRSGVININMGLFFRDGLQIGKMITNA